MTKKQRAVNLHERAVKLAEAYRRQEALIVQILQEIDNEKAYYFYNCKSLFEYATTHLKLTEAVAYAFITVSRKSKEVPELQEKINTGKISVHKAKKICSVLRATKSNNIEITSKIISLNELANSKKQKQVTTHLTSKTEEIQCNKTITQQNNSWLEMAENLSTRKLEEKVANEHPETYQRKEFRKPMGQNMESITLRLSREQVKKLERVKELLSTQKGKAVQILDCFDEMLDLYIEKKDPIKKAERSKNKTANKQAETPTSTVKNNPELNSELNKNKSASGDKTKNADTKLKVNANKSEIKPQDKMQSENCKTQRKPISSALRHEVYLRNGGQCCHRNQNGIRCQSRKWLHIHHKKPVSRGGKNELNNLELICSAHHRQHHFIEEYVGG